MKNEEMKVTMITVNELESVVGGAIHTTSSVGIPRGGKIIVRTISPDPFSEEDDPTKAGIRVKVRV